MLCKSLREPMFDTTSPTGEFLLKIFAGLAQLERRMISQRTKSALNAMIRNILRQSLAPSHHQFRGRLPSPIQLQA